MGVRRISIILLGLIAAGCATAQPKESAAINALSGPPVYSDAPAAALAFDAPIAAGMEYPELARGPRAPSAFFGYTESTVEFFSSATDDLRGNEFGDLYSQEGISVKSGVRYR